jgi:hypothetical protein
MSSKPRHGLDLGSGVLGLDIDEFANTYLGDTTPLVSFDPLRTNSWARPGNITTSGKEELQNPFVTVDRIEGTQRVPLGPYWISSTLWKDIQKSKVMRSSLPN